MLRLLISICLVIFTTVSQASLHPGWRDSGWLEDLQTAKLKSRQSGKPIFLYFDAIWCSWCQEYKRKTLDKPEIQRKLTRDFIPLVIDYDAQPQLFNQLGGRGLPYNVILDHNNKVLNRFVGLLSVPDLLALLDKFSAQPDKGSDNGDSDTFEPVTVTSLDRSAFNAFRDTFLQHIETLYSEEHKTLAGFYESGVTLKRPSPLTWMWLMGHTQWKDRAQLAAKTEAARLWDDVDGGFYQYLQRTPPLADYLETSKLLEVNARLTQWMARTGKHTAELNELARQAVNYLLTRLRDQKTGGFFQSQLADQAYYQLSAQQRSKLPAPAIDRIIRMDTNAQTVIALLDIAHSLKDPKLIPYAIEAYQFILNGMRKNQKFYHLYENGSLSHPAELADQAWLLAAGLELQRVAPDPQQRLRLKELADLLRHRIDKIINTASADPVDQETLGIIAWIVTHPVQRTEQGPLLPVKYAQWALKQLRIEADTSPDSLVIALRAWQHLLNKQ